MKLKIQSFESVIFGATISDTLVKRIINIFISYSFINCVFSTARHPDGPDVDGPGRTRTELFHVRCGFIYLQNINNNINGSFCWNDFKYMYTL